MLNGRGEEEQACWKVPWHAVPGLAWQVQGSGRVLGMHRPALCAEQHRPAGKWRLGLRSLFERHRSVPGHTTAGSLVSWGSLRASRIGNLTDLENAIASGEPAYRPSTHAIEVPRQTVRHHLLKTEACWRPERGGPAGAHLCLPGR